MCLDTRCRRPLGDSEGDIDGECVISTRGVDSFQTRLWLGPAEVVILGGFDGSERERETLKERERKRVRFFIILQPVRVKILTRHTFYTNRLNLY